MSDKPKVANWAPGTLDATRKAIGNIDNDEAAKMAKMLGGEVMYEREAEPEQTPKKSRRGTLDRSVIQKNRAAPKETTTENAPTTRKIECLIPIPQRVNKKIDRLMMSTEYSIKKNYGAFNFIKFFQPNGNEAIITEFFTFTIKEFIDTMQFLHDKVISLISFTPHAYSAKIENDPAPKFLFLRMVRAWDMNAIHDAYAGVQNEKPPYTVTELIGLVRLIYKSILEVYYYGSDKIPLLLKAIYSDCAENPEADKRRILAASREAIRLWLVVDNDIVHRLYPLLMRMTSNTFEEYPEFFFAKKSDILKFLGLRKYDLLLQGVAAPNLATTGGDTQPTKKSGQSKEPGKIDTLTTNGLNLLDKLFPEAGFLKLDEHPDLYPYFQPLYKFADGFNLMCPRNPLQVAIVLIRIIEDLFQACREIDFIPIEGADENADSLPKIIDDWSKYREVVFAHLYCEKLNELVNSVYTQEDFENGQFGKKLKTELFWQINYHFLPYYRVERFVLEKPRDESPLPPIFKRVSYAKRFLSVVVKNCDKEKASHGDVLYLHNPWAHYSFAVGNEVSKRIDVLLGAKNKNPDTNANNANLLKYTLRIMAVLDWWLNNSESPAYDTTPKDIFRVSEEDGKPIFSVDMRKDQNKLFAAACRKAMAKRAQKQAKQ